MVIDLAHNMLNTHTKILFHGNLSFNGLFPFYQ